MQQQSSTGLTQGINARRHTKQVAVKLLTNMAQTLRHIGNQKRKEHYEKRLNHKKKITSWFQFRKDTPSFLLTFLQIADGLVIVLQFKVTLAQEKVGFD